MTPSRLGGLLAVTLLLSIAAPTTVAAQRASDEVRRTASARGPDEAGTAVVGNRVRISMGTASTPIVGEIFSVTDAEILLTLEDGGTMAAPLANIAGIMRSERQRNFAKYFAITTIASAAVTSVAMSLAWEPCTGWCILTPESRGEPFSWGLVAGAVIGVPLGFVMGVAIKEDGWVPVGVAGVPGVGREGAAGGLGVGRGRTEAKRAGDAV